MGREQEASIGVHEPHGTVRVAAVPRDLEFSRLACDFRRECRRPCCLNVAPWLPAGATRKGAHAERPHNVEQILGETQADFGTCFNSSNMLPRRISATHSSPGMTVESYGYGRSEGLADAEEELAEGLARPAVQLDAVVGPKDEIWRADPKTET